MLKNLPVMKQFVLLTFTICFFTHLSIAQSPNSFRYQAVARNASGSVITGDIGVRISFLANSPDGQSHYSETHTASTNAQGVFDLEIGNGEIVSGDFHIDWATNQYWVKVKLKAPGEFNFVEM